MPLIRKRRAQAEASPSPPPTRRRHSPSPSEAGSVIDEDPTGLDDDSAAAIAEGGSGFEQMVKKLVRLALASEYSRQPVRRADITAKVMAPNTGRQFKQVFTETQHHLRTVFGMEMKELPQKEKISIAQKRAAQRSQSSASSSSKSYVLISTLPAQYRTPQILVPARIPSSAIEAAYTGLYTFIISIIALSPRGTIAESRLERHLGRMNADDYVLGGEKTEKVLKRMEREGYIVKVCERDGGGEESIDYVVGPRGKAEVGEIGVAGVVRTVYGKRDVEADELERKLVRSLGDVVIDKKRRKAVEEGEDGGDGGGNVENDGGNDDEGDVSRRDEGPPARRVSARSRRSRNEVEDDEEGEEEEEEEEEDDDDE